MNEIKGTVTISLSEYKELEILKAKALNYEVLTAQHASNVDDFQKAQDELNNRIYDFTMEREKILDYSIRVTSKEQEHEEIKKQNAQLEHYIGLINKNKIKFLLGLI